MVKEKRIDLIVNVFLSMLVLSMAYAGGHVLPLFGRIWGSIFGCMMSIAVVSGLWVQWTQFCNRHKRFNEVVL
jgi:hypothetical protein